MSSHYLFQIFQTCSQLIRAGLKLSLEMKRKTSTGDSSGAENIKVAKRELIDSSDDDDDMDSKSSRSGVSIHLTCFNLQFRN